MSFRVAVLVSGEGTNLQALLDGVHGRDGIEIVAVAASRPEARGLERARRAGVEAAAFVVEDPRRSVDEPSPGRELPDLAERRFTDRPERDLALAEWLAGLDVELVVLAGWMELLGPAFIDRFRGRVVNVHPALLPAFPGLHGIEQALDYGVKVAGVTVHFVDEGTDTGPVLLQEAFELPYDRDIERVEQLFHEVEHRLLPQAVRLIAAGRVHFDDENPRLVRVDVAY